MTLAKDLMNRMMEKFGGVIDLKERPEALDDIVDEVVARMRATGGAAPSSTAPFGVSWMDAWVAHWVYQENLRTARTRDRELASVLQALVDLRFDARINEIRRYVRDAGRFADEPPDGGPPEPGVPEPPAPPEPPGPSRFVPPDGGPPEPGPPEPPGPSRFGAPDGGPPEPGTPPAGPTSGLFGENPWILYWFVSIKAPLLLEVIDLHLSRRLQDVRARGRV